ncbi:MAG: hypothetical protein HY744_20675 [Deltaproteobacteria bacterium]|nr:hypothetical protein [Deltaproteobacteria bacterium]
MPAEQALEQQPLVAGQVGAALLAGNRVEVVPVEVLVDAGDRLAELPGRALAQQRAPLGRARRDRCQRRAGERRECAGAARHDHAPVDPGPPERGVGEQRQPHAGASLLRVGAADEADLGVGQVRHELVLGHGHRLGQLHRTARLEREARLDGHHHVQLAAHAPELDGRARGAEIGDRGRGSHGKAG